MQPSEASHSRILQKAPILVATLPLAAGILVADFAMEGLPGHAPLALPDTGKIALTLLSVLTLAVTSLLNILSHPNRQKRDHSLNHITYPLMLAALGSTVLTLSMLKPQPEWPDEATTWQAFVTDVRETGRTLRLRLTLTGRLEGHHLITRRDSTATIGRKIMVSIQRDTLRREPVRPGEAIVFYGTIRPPRPSGNPMAFDYSAWLQRQNIVGQAFVYNHWHKLPEHETARVLSRQPMLKRIELLFLQWRNGLLDHLNRFPLSDDDRAVLASLTLGSRYHLTKALQHTYAITGGSHVLALSGLHLGILVMFLLTLLRPLHSRIATGLLPLVLIWSFVLLTGMSTSLLRAAVMYSVMTLAMLQKRVSNGLNALGIAAAVLLLASPRSLFDVGFQLSFLAVLSILLLYPIYVRWRPRHRPGRVVCDFIYVAVAAQIGTAPLVACTFNLMPTTVLLTNAIVIPCAYIILGGTLGYFLLLWLGPVRQLLMWAICGTVHLMNQSLSLLSLLPHAAATVCPSALQTLAAYLLMAAILAVILQPRRRTVYAATAALALFISTGIAGRAARRTVPQIVFYNSPSTPAVQFIASPGRTWIWTEERDSLMADEALAPVAGRFWSRRGITAHPYVAGALNTPELKAREQIFHFGGLSTAIVSDNRWERRHPKHPISVDYLYLTRGFRGQLAGIGFRPRTVVLDASLSENRRRQIARQCRAAHVPYYDIALQGALIVKLRQITPAGSHG